ncbi:MAG: cation-efflux pump [Planctomycetes bacterium]|nr:cation-efflux pump [Planctomycetota bacterium]MBM4079866.1 cation-efflux pump [Planctomycetota bacterium]
MDSKSSVALLSVASNVTLTALKLAVGLVTGSISVLSEAAHSATDLFASLVAFFSVRYAGRPRDADHPFGHGKMENLSGLIEGVLILVAAGWIIVESLHRIIDRRFGVEANVLGLLVMAASCVANHLISQKLFRVARETDSMALEADGQHLRTDVWTSLGVFGALGVITAGKGFGLKLDVLDPVAAIGVALLIISVANDVIVRSFQPLMDQRLPEAEEEAVKRIIAESGAGIVTFHQLRTRKSGPYRYIDLHVQVAREMRVPTAHKCAHDIVEAIQKALPNSGVLVHIEPYEGHDDLAASPEVHEQAKRAAMAVAGVKAVPHLTARKVGSSLAISAEVSVDSHVSVADGERIASAVRERLRKEFPEAAETDVRIRPGRSWAHHEPDRRRVSEALANHESPYVSFHDLRVHSHGQKHFVELELVVPARCTVQAAHELCDHLERDIKAVFAGESSVAIHVEPCDEDCPKCAIRCEFAPARP